MIIKPRNNLRGFFYIYSMNKGLAVFISLLLIFIFSACKKYSEGPWISLRSKKERVANTWRIEKAFQNYVDISLLYPGYTETYTKNGTYSYAFGSLKGEGTWTFDNKKEKIIIKGAANQNDRELVILRLKENEFWYYYMDSTVRYDIYLTPY